MNCFRKTERMAEKIRGKGKVWSSQVPFPTPLPPMPSSQGGWFLSEKLEPIVFYGDKKHENLSVERFPIKMVMYPVVKLLQ